jgi:hypothetical protein
LHYICKYTIALHSIIKKTGSFIVSVLLGAFILLILSMLVVSLPPVQNLLVGYGEKYLEKNFGTQVEIGSVDFRLPVKGVLRDVAIYDPNGCELLEIRQFRVNLIRFTLYSFLFKKNDPRALSSSIVELIEPRFHLYRSRTDSLMNIAFLSSGQKPEKPASLNPIRFKFRKISIRDGAFFLQDSLSPLVDSIFPGRFNFKNLWVEGISGDFQLDITPGGRLDAVISDLTLSEAYSGFKLDQLSTRIISDTMQIFDSDGNCDYQSFLEFSDIRLKAQQTDLNASFRFNKERLEDLFDPIPDEQYVAKIGGTFFDFSTLNYFVKNPVPLRGVVNCQGIVTGSFDGVRSRDFKIRYLKDTWLNADLDIQHFQNENDLDINVTFMESAVSSADLEALLPMLQLPGILDSVGRIEMDGAFNGKYFDFHAQADVITDVGSMVANLHMILPPKKKVIHYDGFITTKKLDLYQLGLGKVFPSHNLNFSGTVKGKGVTLKDLNTNFDAKILKSDLFGFDFESVIANVNVSERHVDGLLKVTDSEGNADVKIDLNFAAAQPSYKVEGKVDKLNINRYDIYKEPVWFSSVMEVDMKGDSLDNISGKMNLENIHLEWIDDNRKIDLEKFNLVMDRQSGDSTFITLRSSLMDGDISGDFTPGKAIRLSKRLLHESQLFFGNNDSLINAYYAAKIPDSTYTNVKLDVSTKESVNSLLGFFEIPLYVSGQTTVGGTLSFGNFFKANLTLETDSVNYKERYFRSGTGYIDLTKYADRNALLLVGGASLSHLQVTPTLMLDTVLVDMQWFDNQIEYSLITEQPDLGNKLMLQLTSEYYPDGRIESSINPRVSSLTVGNSKWMVSKKNRIVYMDRQFEIENFLLEADTQFIDLSGNISKVEGSQLAVKVTDLDLKNFSPLINIKNKLSGSVNADLLITDLLTDFKLEADGVLKRFGLDNTEFGDVFVKSEWEKGEERIRLVSRLVKDTDTLISIRGNYSLKDTISPLDFRLNTQTQVPLTYLEPFVKKEIYGLDGAVTLRSFTITGKPEAPVVRGTGHVEKAKFGISYFRTEYRFSGDIVFDKDRITFPTITLFDKNDKTAQFYGLIRHRGLKEFVFDLQLDNISDFLIMDTKKKDNEVFYGTFFIKDGVASITGTLEKISIVADALTGEGTVFNLPIQDFGELGKPDYIYFLGDKDPSKTVKTGIQGFDLNLTVSATKEARANLIFDEKVGDIISGRGEGNINLTINEQGDFAMYGNYNILEGEYLFTAQSIVNKRFLVKPDGSVSWSGDPYEAQVDIQAYYPLSADIRDFKQSDQIERIPVNVLMHMKGSLMQPEIELAIEIPNLNQQNALEIITYLQTIQYDEQELNKQIFSLMVFHRFAPVGGNLGQSVAGTGVTTSISELLSNQLNYWISQALDDKLSVAVASNDLQDVDLLVSAKLFNDRVTIERDGTIASATSNVTLGNISIIIRLLPRPPKPDEITPIRSNRQAELVFEVFNRESLDVQLQNRNQAGLGLFFKKDFDRLKEFLGKE